MFYLKFREKSGNKKSRSFVIIRDWTVHHYAITNFLFEIKFLQNYVRGQNWKQQDLDISQVCVGIWALPFTVVCLGCVFLNWAGFLNGTYAANEGGWLLVRVRSTVQSLEQHEWWKNRDAVTASVISLLKAFLKIFFRLDLSITLWCLYGIYI